MIVCGTAQHWQMLDQVLNIFGVVWEATERPEGKEYMLWELGG